MRREECLSFTREIYQLFYRGVTLRHDYVLPENRTNEIALNRFVDYLEKGRGLESIGVDWLVDFIELSFHWWYKKKDRLHELHGHTSIKLNWIIGISAMDRYEKMGDRRNLAMYLQTRIRKDVGLGVRRKLNRISTESIRDNQAWLLLAETAEEEEKKRLYNKPEGLFWCKANTTLFNHVSTLCAACYNRTRCKELLKKEFPKLYRLRGYEQASGR